MRTVNQEQHNKKKIDIMEKCFDCYAEYGFGNVGIKGLGKACGITHANLYVYFENIDDLVIQATEHCMSKVEDDFMAKAPMSLNELEAFIDEIPYWTRDHHGKKYRLMYQIYTDPRYIEHGKKFFDGVNHRYTEHAKILESKLGIPYTTIVSFMFILIRASVHYAMFEDEYYLQAQLTVLKQSLKLMIAAAKEPPQA